MGPDVEAALPDLTDVPLERLAEMGEALAPYTEAVLKQVERPRVNLGGSGPPGRAD